MRLFATIIPVSLSFGIACLVGCSAEHVTAVDDTDALVSDDLPVEGDPWGVCDVNFTCSNPDGGCMGWADPGSCPTVEGEECKIDRYLLGCVHWCNSNADCPAPLSGDAESVCSDDGECFLTCDDGTTCPNGYECVASPEYVGTPSPFPPHMCMQVFDPDAIPPSVMPEE